MTNENHLAKQKKNKSIFDIVIFSFFFILIIVTIIIFSFLLLSIFTLYWLVVKRLPMSPGSWSFD